MPMSLDKMWSSSGIKQVGHREVLAAKMQLVGCHMTRDIIAQIETHRSTVNDERIMFFAKVFGVEIGTSLSSKFWKQINVI